MKILIFFFSFDYYKKVCDALLVKWLASLEMDTETQVQIMDEAVCISRCVNTFGKGLCETPSLCCN